MVGHSIGAPSSLDLGAVGHLLSLGLGTAAFVSVAALVLVTSGHGYLLPIVGPFSVACPSGCHHLSGTSGSLR